MNSIRPAMRMARDSDKFARTSFAKKVLSGLSSGMAFACVLTSSSAALAGDLFSGTNLVHIAIEIPKEGMDKLRSYHWDLRNPDQTNRPHVLARVIEGQTIYSNVLIHSKGAVGSFRPVDDLPALTLNFGHGAKGQKFHDMTKVCLNNSVQDPTCLHEILCRELFVRAGVPVPQADHAVVTLNGRGLGLYVVTEGFGKRFLKRHFKKADGNLYDGGYLRDIDQPRRLRVDLGDNPEGLPALERLSTATRQPNPAARFEELNRVLDVDRFLSMLALEVMLCHWDGYSMNRNNYRVYFDPGASKVIFMPHGMDQVLGIDRQNLDLPLLPRLPGRVAQALVTTPEGRRKYLERVRALATNLFKPDELCRHLRQLDTQIAPELAHPETRWPLRSQNPRAFITTTGDHQRDIDELCQRISTRGRNLQQQLDTLGPGGP